MKVKSVCTVKIPPFDRWIIVLPAAKDWAWSGSRWVQHRNGLSIEAQVANFETEKEALDYAAEHCIERQELCNRMHRRGPSKWTCVLDKGHKGECAPFAGTGERK